MNEFDTIFNLFILFCYGFSFLTWIIATIYVSVDAKKNNLNPIFWGVFCGVGGLFSAHLVILSAYFFVTKRKRSAISWLIAFILQMALLITIILVFMWKWIGFWNDFLNP